MRIKSAITGLLVIGLVVANVYVLMKQVSIIDDPIFPQYQTMVATIGSQKYTLYVADSPAKRTQGLSGLEELPQNKGMIFIFDTAEEHSFWMKDMYYPLDFIFVNEGIVVDIIENVLPESYPDMITSSVPSNKVIELNTGEVQRSGIKKGDAISAVLD